MSFLSDTRRNKDIYFAVTDRSKFYSFMKHNLVLADQNFRNEFIIRKEFPSFVTLNRDDPGYGICGIHGFNLISVCTAKFKKVSTDQVLYKMTLPKGFGPGGRRVEGGGSRDDVEKMIGRRVENYRGILILGFALCWAATAGGVYVGVTVYPWAYPLPSGIYALSVLTVIEALGFFWMWKIATEKPLRPY